MHQLSGNLVRSAEKTLQFFESRMLLDGSYGEAVTDISCYYKSPMMFLRAGKSNRALQLLDYVKTNFLQSDGDFLSSGNIKSTNSAYTEFWTYTNGWLVRASQQLFREDISKPALIFLDRFKNIDNGGFFTHRLDLNDKITDVLTTALHGHIRLERGDIATAVESGNYLINLIGLQPDLIKGFYLRLDKQGNLITDFPKNESSIHWINREEPEQLYFMLGYPIAYLGFLFQSTQNFEFFEAAYRYVDFVLSCHEDIFSSNYSHKVAWACSVLFSIRPDQRLEKLITRVMKHFLITQSEEGVWFLEKDILMAYDQSAEIACWFLETAKNIEIGLQKETAK
ncbi:MAG TPA: hypothetical protein VGH95_03535 [Candidatus Aquirickettsiella sp.]